MKTGTYYAELTKRFETFTTTGKPLEDSELIELAEYLSNFVSFMSATDNDIVATAIRATWLTPIENFIYARNLHGKYKPEI